MMLSSAPAGTFCHEGPPSLIHFHNHDVFAQDDPAPAAAARASGNSLASASTASSQSIRTSGTSRPTRQRRRVALALYDLDGTIIRTRDGYPFPRDANDWVWWSSEVPKRLRADVASGRHVVILSNQHIYGRNLQDWKDKIQMIARDIDNVPIRVLAALDHDKYRKPDIGMLEYLLRMYAERGWEVDLRKSFYVGDAAGRPGDHSADDRNMALNAGLTFRTPEHHFSLPHPPPTLKDNANVVIGAG